MTYLASSCFNFHLLKDLLAYCRQHGFYQLELGGDLFGGSLNQPGFSFLIHNYFPRPKEDFVLNLASADKNIRQKSLNHCFQAIKICQQLKIPFYSVHAGFLFDPPPAALGHKQSHLPFIDRGQGLKLFKESVTQLLAEGVNLLIENNVNSRENLIEGKNELYLLAEPEETLKFLQQFNHPLLGLLVDLGHLNVSSKQLNFDKNKYLEVLAPWIKAFHLSANNGIEDQGLPFSDDEWFIGTLKKFENVTKIIEISNQSNESDLRNCLEIIDNL